jgi:hypothetical protein
MDKCWHHEIVVMDGPEPVELRHFVSITMEFSCPLERALHLLNRDLLISRRLGWKLFAPPSSQLALLMRRALLLYLESV